MSQNAQNPRPFRAIGRGVLSLPVTTASDLIATTKTALLGVPSQALRGFKEERLAFEGASVQERRISRGRTTIYAALILLSCLAVILAKTLGAVVSIGIGIVYFCARFGWWDPVRDYLTRTTLQNGWQEGEAESTIQNQALQQEIATYKLELVFSLIKEWNALPKTERGPKAPETILALLETIERPIGGPAKSANSPSETE